MVTKSKNEAVTFSKDDDITEELLDKIKNILDANDKTLTLYAQYNEDRWLTFDLDGGTLYGETELKIRVKTGTIFVMPAPTKAGNKFLYWQGSIHYAGEEYPVEEDHTFKAIWAREGGSDGSQTYTPPKTGIE